MRHKYAVSTTVFLIVNLERVSIEHAYSCVDFSTESSQRQLIVQLAEYISNKRHPTYSP